MELDKQILLPSSFPLEIGIGVPRGNSFNFNF